MRTYIAGPAGCGKTTVAKALCAQLGVDVYVINGSDEGRFLDTVRNTVRILLDSIPPPKQNIKLLSSMRQTTPRTTFNSFFVHLRKSLVAIVDLSSPVTTRAKSSNRFTPGARVLTFQPIPKTNHNLAHFKRIQQILDTEGVEFDNKVLVELIISTSLTGVGFLTNCNYSVGGKIDSGILATFSMSRLNRLLKILRRKISRS